MSKAMPFDKIAIGEELGPWEIMVSQEAVQRYCDDWDDHNPLYLRGTSSRGPIMPPAFMAGLACFRLLGLKYDARTTVGTRTEHENLRPMAVGQKLTTFGRVTEKYIKRG